MGWVLFDCPVWSTLRSWFEAIYMTDRALPFNIIIYLYPACLLRGHYQSKQSLSTEDTVGSFYWLESFMFGLFRKGGNIESLRLC